MAEQRNVMLKTDSMRTEELSGKPFPCPLCGMSLPIEITCKQKPYCTYNACGIQLFFRGKSGIRRLQEMTRAAEPMRVEFRDATRAVALYNRLTQLKQQRDELEQKQGIIFRDQDLDAAISAVDREIKQTQSQLEKAGTRK